MKKRNVALKKKTFKHKTPKLNPFQIQTPFISRSITQHKDFCSPPLQNYYTSIQILTGSHTAHFMGWLIRVHTDLTLAAGFLCGK